MVIIGSTVMVLRSHKPRQANPIKTITKTQTNAPSYFSLIVIIAEMRLNVKERASLCKFKLLIGTSFYQDYEKHLVD